MSASSHRRSLAFATLLALQLLSTGCRTTDSEPDAQVPDAHVPVGVAVEALTASLWSENFETGAASGYPSSNLQYLNVSDPSLTPPYKRRFDVVTGGGTRISGGAHAGNWLAWFSQVNGELIKQVDTRNYPNLSLSYWRRVLGFESNDRFYVRYSITSSTGPWTNLQTISTNNSTWTQSTITLPADASNNIIYLSFFTDFKTSSGVIDEWVYLDDFTLTGGCSQNSECSDGIACTSDSCCTDNNGVCSGKGGQCLHTIAPNDVTCDGNDDNCSGQNDEGYVSVATSCGVGACASSGMSSCVSGAVQSNCTPGTAAASDAICNGVDEDCSGTADEDFAGQSTSCGIGACARTGTTSCVNGAVQDSCATGTPAANDATCNAADDNCNGMIDESCVPTLPARTNLVQNGTFEGSFAPNYGQKLSADRSQIFQAPEIVSLETTDTGNGSSGALRVSIVKDPAYAYYGHYTGAVVPLNKAVPVEPTTWLDVRFRAKSVSGETVLSVTRLWGGGYDRVELTKSWRTYEVPISLGFGTNTLIFALNSNEGVFLIDDIEAFEVPSLTVNGSFTTDIAPVTGAKNDPTTGPIPAPEIVSYDTNTATGHGASLHVNLTPQAGFNYDSQNSGAVIPLASSVPAGSWLRIAFFAKYVRGASLLNVMSASGRSTSARVRLDSDGYWYQYFVSTQLLQDTNALIFNLVPTDQGSLQSVADGEFLLDEVNVSVVAGPSQFVRCGDHFNQVCEPDCGITGQCPPAVLDSLTEAPLAAYSAAERVRTSYLGPAIRVRRASDQREYKVGFAGQGQLNETKLRSFCGSSDCYLSTLYDQSGNGRDLDESGVQIKFYDGGTHSVVARDGLLPALDIRTDAASIYRSDSLGLVGNPAMAVAYAGRYVGAGASGADVSPIRIGGTGSGVVRGELGLSYQTGENFVDYGGGDFGWSVPANTVTHTSVFQHAAGASSGTSSLWIDGVAASFTTTPPTDDGFHLGATTTLIGKDVSDTSGAKAHLRSAIIWNAMLSAADRARIDGHQNASGGGCAPVQTCVTGDGCCPASCTNPSDGDCSTSTIGSSCNSSFVPVGTSCGIGACSRGGVLSCVNNTVQNSCVAGTPAASDVTCNGVDDNCNGTVDDGCIPTDVKAIGAGGDQTCTVRADDGAVFCWGNGSGYHQIVGITGAVQVESSFKHACAVLADRTVRCWGDDGYGQLGDGAPHLTGPVQVQNLSDALQVSLGEAHSCALRATGQVVCWGINARGELGNGTTTNSDVPSPVPGISDAVHISAGHWQTCAVRQTGGVTCWGDNRWGQLGDGTTQARSAPVAVVSVTNAVQVAAGTGFTCARLQTGSVVCWGDDGQYQLGDGPGDATGTAPVAVVGLNDAVDLTAGNTHACARRLGGPVVCWGMNGAGQLGDGTTVSRQSPVAVPGVTATAIAAGFTHTCAFDNSGTVFCWGSNQWQQLSNEDYAETNTPHTVGNLTDAVSIDAEGFHTCAKRANGQAVCWGQNSGGELGDGSTIDRASPVAVQGLSNPLSVVAGRFYSCAVNSNATASCWGRNNASELGDGTFNDSAIPVGVVGLSDVRSIAAGLYSGCAITGAGQVACWPDTGASHGVYSVTGISTAQRLAGFGHYCATLSNGHVTCWGANNYGQLGDATTTTRSTPADVLGVVDAIAVGTGDRDTCVVRQGGTVSCWGDNTYGELGSGTTSSSVPVAVPGVSAATGVDVGYFNVCVVQSTGHVVCWGSNSFGEAGLGTYTQFVAPTEVVGVNDAVEVAVGNQHACARHINGTVSCWGNNADGEVGTGTFARDIAPTPVVPILAPVHRCGDGVLQGAEQCDDGNTNNADGCRSDCTPGCSTGADCSDGIQCTDDICSGTTGQCSHAPTADGTVCHDRPLQGGGVGDGVCDGNNACILRPNPLGALFVLTPETIAPQTEGTEVQTWSDANGGGVVFSGAGGGNRPVVRTEGKRGAAFYGDDYMTGSFGDTSSWSGITVVAAVRTLGTSEGLTGGIMPQRGALLGSGGPAGSEHPTSGIQWAAGVGTDPAAGLGWAGSDGTTNLGRGRFDPRTRYVLSWKRGRAAGSGWTVRRNGTPQATSPIPDSSFSTGEFNAYLGVEGKSAQALLSPGQFILYELHVYPRELSDAETTLVEQQLAAAYDIGWYEGGSTANPNDILGSDLFAWYDASQLSASDGAAIANWPSRTSSAPLIASGSSQPLYNARGINGHPSVVGDGSNDFAFANFDPALPVGSRPYVWLVMRHVTPPTQSVQPLMLGPGNMAGQFAFLLSNGNSSGGGGWLTNLHGGSGQSIVSTTSMFDANTHIISTGLSADFENQQQKLDGIPSISHSGDLDPGATTVPISDFSLFANYNRTTNQASSCSNAAIGEVIVSRTSPSTEVDVAIQRYLAAKWAPPSGCSSSYPCDDGGTCTTAADCRRGLTCGNTGAGTSPVCGGCTSNSDCADGSTCGMDNGTRFGLNADVRACWPAICDSPDPRMAPCGTMDSPCGLCPACVPHCGEKVCGDDGCGGSCGTCPSGTTCKSEEGVCYTSFFADTHQLPRVETSSVGAIPGTFAVSDTGDATYRIPIDIPPGRGGIQPELALRYNSAQGDGYLGVGWSLEGLSAVMRCNKTVAQDTVASAPDPHADSDTDAFCLDGRRLVFVADHLDAPHATNTREYRTEEDQFARIQATFDIDGVLQEQPVVHGPRSFTVYAKDGRIFEYGTTADSLIAADAPAGYTGGQVWALKTIKDRTGNQVVIHYAHHSHQVEGGLSREYYPDAIYYGSPLSPILIKFVYDVDLGETRPDGRYAWKNGVQIAIAALLKQIEVHVDRDQSLPTDQNITHKYLLQYESLTPPGTAAQSRLTSVLDCTGSNICKGATSFSYAPANASLGSARALADYHDIDRDRPAGAVPQTHVLDLNGDGIDDVLFVEVTEDEETFIPPHIHKVTSYNIALSHIAPDGTYSHSQTGGILKVSENTQDVGTDDEPMSGFGDGVVVDWDNDGRQELLEIDHHEDGLPDEYTIVSLVGTNLVRTRTGIPSGGNVLPLMVDLNGDHFKELLLCKPGSSVAEWTVYGHQGGQVTGAVMPSGNGVAYLTDQPRAFDLDVPCGKILPIDTDGDGAEELLIESEESAFTSRVVSFGFSTANGGTVIPIYGPTNGGGPGAPRLLDINGDGLQDIVRVRTDPDDSSEWILTIQISKGNGFFLTTGRTVAKVAPYQSLDQAIAWDANGDGRQDMLMPDRDAGAAIAWLSAGSAFNELLTLEPVDPELGSSFYLSLPQWVPFDGDGDGVPGLLNIFKLWDREPSTFARGRLTEVADGLGASTVIEYRSLTDPTVHDSQLFNTANPVLANCRYPFLCVVPRGPVVSRHLEFADPSLDYGLARKFNYQYAGARIDALGHGALGFANRTIWEGDPGSGGKKRSTFIEYDNRTWDEQSHSYPFAFKKRHITSSAFVGDLEWKTDTSFDYQLTRPTANSYAPVVHVSTHERSTRDVTTDTTTPLGSETGTVESRDNYGNVLMYSWTDNVHESRTFMWGFKHQQDTSFRDAWLISLPTFDIIEAAISDTGESKVRTTIRDYFTTGLLKSETVQADRPNQLTTTYQRTTVGSPHVITQTDDTSGVSRTTTIDYDDRLEWPVAVTNAKNQQTKMGFDRAFGTAKFVEDPNGITTQWGYDDFGRLGVVETPDGGLTTTTYSTINAQLPLAIETRRAGGARVVAELDVRGRIKNRRTWGLNGQELLQSFVYDVDGNVGSASRATEIGQAAVPGTDYTFDNAGRVVTQTTGGLEVTDYCYQDRTACIHNPNGYSTCTIRDHLGRVASTYEPINASCETALLLSPLQTPTSYQYGAFGDLVAITDRAGNITSVATDDLGRKSTFLDPDVGVQTYSYNGFGELTAIETSGQRSIEFHYDALGRQISRIDHDLTQVTADQTTQWIWDGGSDGVDLTQGELVGRLTQTVSPDGPVQRLHYDTMHGVLERIDDQIQGTTFETSIHRDELGRVWQIDYPQASNLAAFSVVNTYDNYGHLLNVAPADSSFNAVPYWTANETNSHGQLQGESFGDDTFTGWLHDDHGRPDTITTTFLTFPSQSLKYTYDANGNVKTRTDLLRSRTENFDYDGADRIVSDSGAGGATFNYHDGIGNLYERSDVRYDQAQPHAIGFDGTYTYSYDALGQRIAKEGAGLTERTSYTAFGKPLEIWNENTPGDRSSLVSFKYDAGQQRVIKESDQATTIYIEGMYERRTPKAGGAATHIYYVTNGTRIVAQIEMRSGATTQTRYLHVDGQGTPRLITGGSGGAVELDYDAFGKRRSPDWSTSSLPSTGEMNIGYTGQEDDSEHGLINMGGRIYDPKTRQFTSPDPVVQDPFSAAGLNRYSYVWNNPLGFVDPTGFDGEEAAEAPPDSEGPPMVVIGTRITDPTGVGLGDLGPPDPSGSLTMVLEPGSAFDVSQASADAPLNGVAGVPVPTPDGHGGRCLGQYCVTASGQDYRSDAPSNSPDLMANEPRFKNNYGELADNYRLALDLAMIGMDPEAGFDLFVPKAIAKGAASKALEPIAVGLSRSASHRPGLVGRFAEELGAITYWEVYPGALPSNAEILARMTEQFSKRNIVVNLSGLNQVIKLGVNAGLRAIVQETAMAVTEAEIATILKNPSFFQKARFFFNGAEVTATVDRTLVIAR